MNVYDTGYVIIMTVLCVHHDRELKNCVTHLFCSVSPLFLTPISLFPLFPADLCSLDNGDCSHNCTVAPGEGVVCSCPLGMELDSNNKTCQIQSFCAKHLKCSQRCEQDKFSVKCSCYEGWELEPDQENCKSTGEEGRREWKGRLEGRKGEVERGFGQMVVWSEIREKGGEAEKSNDHENKTHRG